MPHLDAHDRRDARATSLVAAACALAGCDATPPVDAVPPSAAPLVAVHAGPPAAAGAPRPPAPLAALATYLDGFHLEGGRADAQVEVHHWCTSLDDDVVQCVVFDGDRRDARLLGVEYIVTEPVFRALPPEEQALWHSHRYDVRSGTLVAPGLRDGPERALMERLATTWGKAWHTWPGEAGRTVPLGAPRLMSGFTRDGEADPRLVAARDGRLGVSSAALARARADIAARPADDDAEPPDDVRRLAARDAAPAPAPAPR